MVKESYQVRNIGESAGDSWNRTKSVTCVEWSESPEGREVIALDIATGGIRALPLDEVRREVRNYNALRKRLA